MLTIRCRMFDSTELRLAALLLAVIAVLHSALGERYLLAPLFALERWPHRALPQRFARRTLRFAWHLTTIAWWGWAAILAAPRTSPVLIVAVGLLVTALVIGFASRGAHFAWPVFAVSAGAALSGHLGGRAVTAAVAPSLSVTGAVLLALIGAVHVYWALGGRRGWKVAVPEDPQNDGAPRLRPGPFATALVAVGLAGASALLLALRGIVPSPLAPGVARGMAWALAAVFALRVVGDVHWVGLFKRVRGTEFARLDDALYVPLCFFLALASAATAADAY
jgi:hypothetical protein